MTKCEISLFAWGLIALFFIAVIHWVWFMIKDVRNEFKNTSDEQDN